MLHFKSTVFGITHIRKKSFGFEHMKFSRSLSEFNINKNTNTKFGNQREWHQFVWLIIKKFVREEKISRCKKTAQNINTI